MTLPAIVASFLPAVGRRDPEAVGACFTDYATYTYAVPLPALEGRTAITGMFRTLLTEAERACWDVVTSCVDGDRVWIERVDRFWFDGREVTIECTGVVELAGDRITAVRDYVDLQTWQQRKAAS